MSYVNLYKKVRSDYSYKQKQRALNDAYKILNNDKSVEKVEDLHHQLSMFDYLRKSD